MTAQVRKTKKYSALELFGGNFLIGVWIALGAVTCSIFFAWAGLAFFALAAFLIFYEIGKHGCVTCYYCETCTMGMGKLPDLFFKSAGTANVNKRALNLFPAVYVMLSGVPIVLAVVSILQDLLVYKVALLAAIATFSAYVGAIRRKNLIP